MVVDPPVAALLVIQGARSKFHAVESGSSGSSGKALSRARQRVARCWTWCGGVTTAHKEKESSAPAEYSCRVQTSLKMFETFGGLNVFFLSWNITFLQSFIP